MTKKTRTILFFVLIILFLIVAPATVFYSRGYRFDFGTKRITQTGAFYFKVSPKTVQVYLTPLNSNFFSGGQKIIVKKTDFFFGAVLIENLSPKKYAIEIKKEGFYPWKKTLEIKEKRVADAKNIVLIPENPQSSVFSKGTEDFFVAPDAKRIVLKEIGPAGDKDWTLKLLELEKNLKSHLVNREDISKTKALFLDLKFSSDSKRILLKTSIKEELKYFLIDLEKTPPSLVPLDFLGKEVEEKKLSSPPLAIAQEIEDIFFHPLDNQKLFLLKEEGVFEGDLIQKKVSQAILENVSFFQVFNKDIYYFLDSGPEAGFLFKTDSSFSRREKINRTPFSPGEEDKSSSLPTELLQGKNEGKDENEVLFASADARVGEGKKWRLEIFLDKIFLHDNRNLYLLNSDSNNFDSFSEASGTPKISPDFKKLVYFSDHEIGIFFLKEEFGQPQKKAGERQFIARFSEKIGDVFWLTAHYLVFNVGYKIKIAEIDDRDKINMVDFLELKEPKIFWNNALKKLYILSGGNLYWSEVSLP